MILSELVAAYVEENYFRSATVVSYHEKIRALIREVGDIELSQVRPKQLMVWRDEMLRSGISTETWNSRRRHLSTLFRWAVKRGHLAVSPFAQVPQGMPQRRRKKTVDHATLDAIMYYLDQLEQSRSRKFRPQYFWRCMIRTFYWTGIRRSQLVALRWQDVDLDAKTILLRAEASKTHREHVIPIATQLFPHLQALRQRALYQWHCGQGTDGRFARSQVFNLALAASGTVGTNSLTVTQVSSAFARISKATETRFSPHRLRHTLATQLVHAEVDLVHIKEMLGHSDLTTTAIYVEPSLKRLQDAVDRLSGP